MPDCEGDSAWEGVSVWLGVAAGLPVPLALTVLACEADPLIVWEAVDAPLLDCTWDGVDVPLKVCDPVLA